MNIEFGRGRAARRLQYKNVHIRFDLDSDWPQVEALMSRSGHQSTQDLLRAALAHYARQFPDGKRSRKSK